MENKGIVLLVEDNEKLNSANLRALRLRGFDAYAALTLQRARELLSQIKPDVILLDIMMPDGDGVDFCVEIKDCADAHILFLTAKAEHGDRLRGLISGGDDYITKPFHPEELMARVEAAIRRRNRNKSSDNMLTKGALTLNATASIAAVRGRDLLLTPKEFALLYLLAQNEGMTFSAADLYEKVWGRAMSGDGGALKNMVYTLRHKLSASGYSVANERGRGYSFQKSAKVVFCGSSKISV